MAEGQRYLGSVCWSSWASVVNSCLLFLFLFLIPWFVSELVEGRLHCPGHQQVEGLCFICILVNGYQFELRLSCKRWEDEMRFRRWVKSLESWVVCCVMWCLRGVAHHHHGNCVGHTTLWGWAGLGPVLVCGVCLVIWSNELLSTLLLAVLVAVFCFSWLMIDAIK